MAGTLQTPTHPNMRFSKRVDGLESCIGAIVDGAGAEDFVVLVRYPGDGEWTPVDYSNYAGDEEPLVKEILQGVGQWQVDSTWAAIEAGAVFKGSDGHDYTGTDGVNRRFGEWIIKNTVFQSEMATDNWARGHDMVPWMQMLMDRTVNAIPTVQPPLPPVPPAPPTALWPPGAVGVIQNAKGLWEAQGSRLTNSIDPSNPMRFVVGIIPVPT